MPNGTLQYGRLSQHERSLRWAFFLQTLIDGEENVENPPANEQTPLHKAAMEGQLLKVKVSTRLMRFAVTRRILCLQELLADGESVDAEDEDGWTPLHHAARYGYTEIVQVSIGRHFFVH